MASSAPISKPLNNLLLDGGGRTALITGAAGGVGRAVASLFIENGVRVLASDLRFSHEAPACLRFDADLTSESDVDALLRACAVGLGRLDFVVHCAGAVGKGSLAEMTLEAWRDGVDVNLTSAFLLARAVSALAESQGALVLMSSPNGVHGGSALSGPAYAASKAGILNLTRYLAKEWAPLGVRVNCVVPGAVDTPMLARLSPTERDALRGATPLQRLTSPRDVAAACAFLCSEHARSITGAALNVTGGRLLP